MDLGAAMSVAQTLLAALTFLKLLADMCSDLGYHPEFENLENIVLTVKAVLQDAEAKQELSHEAQCYIEQLKDTVYDADDLIDEFVTRAELNQKQLAKGQKLSEKMRRLFISRLKDLGVARNLSRRVKEVRKRLDAIANNHNRFGFKLDAEPIRKRGEETCSYVYEKEIIGREADKEKIVGMLLDCDVQRDVSFLSIVGIGGLGKTALAQHVYNDKRVAKHFELRLWACVSDEDPIHLNAKAIISKILESRTNQNFHDSSMEWLQGQLRQLLSGKKYLLVLDDVWIENRDDWLKLEKFLTECISGSWVMVTTRSKQTAKVVRDRSEYELKGLSEEDSWRLFERIAFGQGEGQANPHDDLVEIGQRIVKKCANVPLAIKVVASLLYGQGRDKWQSFNELGLAEIGKGDNGISPILKLSYHNLDSRLKSCFSYCAIFPKDFEIEKEMLISLWMAQGYIVPDGGQSMEDVAEAYFSILLRRCFFQDVREDEYTGDICWCKMHDLMHDIAQEVAGNEVFMANSSTSNFDRKTRHVSYAQKGKYTKGEGPFTTKIGIRTCLLLRWGIELPVGVLLANWMCLRTLDLHKSGIKTLPFIIGKLLHLRYLDLSFNCDLEVLPKSITKLHNLQCLKLSRCSRLKELPNDLSKLAKLGVLDIDKCDSLTHMPPDVCKLNCLYRLPLFVVGEVNSSSKQGLVDQLEDLKALLTNLEGHLEIWIKTPVNGAYVKRNNSDQERYMRSKPHLKSIQFNWQNEEWEEKQEHQDTWLEDMLQPCSNLRILKLRGYGGKRIPASWVKEGNFGTLFPNLVRIDFYYCHGLQHLMLLGNLPHLRYLWVVQSIELEYMEDRIKCNNTSSSDAGPSLFFPSLEQLWLLGLPKLKGWWRDDDDGSSSSSSVQPRVLPWFPRLSVLSISYCPELIRIPLCPTVKQLFLTGINKRLQVMQKRNRDQERGLTSSSNSSPSDSGKSKLWLVSTDNVRGLKWALPMEEAFRFLTDMIIDHDLEVESLEAVREVFQICSSSLKSLRIWNCYNLRSLSMSSHGDGYMPYLTSLQSLEIKDCKALKSLPEWIPSLTSLTRIELTDCSEELKQRCQSPDGEDWPHIQHIPNLTID